MGIRLASFSLLAGIAALGLAADARAGDFYLTGQPRDLDRDRG